jgi:ribosomal protection tetracycline resistance protein
MRTLNLGILAHVDAGKTSLTERLLFAAGVIQEIGSVDRGDTQTDTLALERRRGITIKAAVASFAVNDVAINLIDTPGHPDFIAEVERVLCVLDGAVLVISAVEGVQAQTRILMRALQRLRIPTLIFVNKIDRRGAQSDALLASIAERLTPAIIAMGEPREMGGPAATFGAYPATDAAFKARLAERLADHDAAILDAYLDSRRRIAYRALRLNLARQTGQAVVHPVFFGSAITGAGVEALVDGIAELLPATGGDADGPVSATIFKVERGSAGERIAFARMFSGALHTRDRLAIGGRERRLTALAVFDRGPPVRRDQIVAGQIGKLWGLGDIRIGDEIGAPRAVASRGHFAPPTLETVVAPRHAAEGRALHVALAQLAEQDPLIDLRQDDVRQEVFVSLYGEVQKEVIGETLVRDFGIEVDFRETTPLCVERVIGSGEALDEAPRPFVATIGLRIEAAPVDSGVAFRSAVEFRSLPNPLQEAVETGVRETLLQGLHGWPVTDCIVTVTQSIRLRHWATTTAWDHRTLAPLVLMAALQQAGTVVCEPIHRFRLQAPADTLAAILPMLNRLLAVPLTQEIRVAVLDLEGEIPAARVHDLQIALPSLTRGEGVLESAFDRYRPAPGAPPSRPRTDNNPLDRREYIRRAKR